MKHATKGIILAGGTGSRLYPSTSLYSKQLVTVYDKPMIYYPLSTLMLADVRELLLISAPAMLPWYRRLLGDGSHLGLAVEYAEQAEPRGIAEAFLIGADFLDGDGAVLILGDNILYGYLDFLRRAVAENEGATIFAYLVRDPERYGVVEFDDDGRVLSLEEKPERPRTHYAVPGLYVYDGDVVDVARTLAPSARGELEITDLNKAYLERGTLRARRIGRGFAWLDSGTPRSLLEAGNFIATVEARQGMKIGCIEEIAFRRGFIDGAQYAALRESMPDCEYRTYLEAIEDELAAGSGAGRGA
ncbi:glucose-1-phosphate thymidylyltransferase RfbA [bacterium]|nr:glucose-1-phosphate thymidylyltransferase RfbA [bacterium]